MYAYDTVGPVQYWFTDAVDGDLTKPAVRGVLADRLGVDEIATMNQVHGAAVVEADPAFEPDADAQWTDRPGLALLARAADCVPVVLATEGAVGVIHAGRRGLIEGVVPAAVAALRRDSEAPVTAWVGPRICPGCYQLDAASAHDVADVVPQARATSREGAPSADIGKGVITQLRALGVAAVDVGWCTREDERFFSYRRGSDPRRQGAIVVLR